MFYDNSAQSHGGALSCVNSILNITNDEFVEDIHGSSERAKAEPNITYFYNNRANIGGGGIFLSDSIAKLSGSIIELKKMWLSVVVQCT